VCVRARVWYAEERGRRKLVAGLVAGQPRHAFTERTPPLLVTKHCQEREWAGRPEGDEKGGGR